MTEPMMDYDKLIAAIRMCGSTPKIDQCKRCIYWNGGNMEKCIPRMTGDAAAAIENLLSYLSTVEADRGAARKEVERLKTAMHEKGIIDGLDEDRKHHVWCAACRWSRPEEIDKMWVIHCAKLGIPVWNNFFCAFFEESKA